MAALLNSGHSNHFDDHARDTVIVWQPRIIIGAAILIAVLGMALALSTRKPKAAVPIYLAVIDPQTGGLLASGHPVAASSAQAQILMTNIIERFIEDSRGITNNVRLEADRINHAYAVARGPALQTLDHWYHDHDEAHNAMDLAAAGKWTEVDITRCLRQGEPDTWRVEWRESDYDAHSTAVSTMNWEASVTTATTPDGIFIIHLDWQQDLSQGGTH
jgi:type IV secretory pathway TrbF-like protein